jgi:ABC-type multidrug transport system permease subunit
VISTSLYFVVFGAAIGGRMRRSTASATAPSSSPASIMLALLTQSISNASFGIYFPRFVGTIYELLSAPVSPLEIVIAYVGAAATKSILLGIIILAHRGLLRAAAHRASVVDAGLPGAHRGDLQPASASSSASGRRASRSSNSCRCSW